MSASTLSGAQADRTTVTLVNVTDNRSLNAITDSLRQAFTQHGFDVLQIASASEATVDAANSNIVITVGNESLSWLADLDSAVPVLSISTGPVDSLRPGQSHLEIRQPLCRQLHMIAAISEAFSSVSVIEPGKPDRRALSRCDKPDGFKINIIERRNDEPVNNLIKRALISDVLLATPNSDIYNRRTIKNVLLLSYRNRIPVVGFSRSFVDAGALAALHSTEDTITQQAVSIVTQRLRNDRFDEDDYQPESFDISINRQVSRSLGIDMPENDVLRRALDGGQR